MYTNVLKQQGHYYTDFFFFTQNYNLVLYCLYIDLEKKKKKTEQNNNNV
jgi:hypothetical protein